MLTTEQNATLTQVGPGTLMGNLMRQYWLPALQSTELAEPDGAPLRLRLLGENLVAWRDTSGAVGVMQESCPHRGASLFFGRNEETGLRCVYHGWKFDTSGACTDMPNEPAESNFKHKIHATAYPAAERGGVIWLYMGPRETAPSLPAFEPNMLDNWNVSSIQRECNWLQALEGDIDTSHLGFLHLGSVKAEDTKPGTFDYYTVRDRTPSYAVVDTDFGTMYGAYRPAEPDTDYWRLANFLFPCFTMIPTGVLGLRVGVRAWVPLDDSHTMYWQISSAAGTRLGLSGGARTAQGGAFANPDGYYQPNTSDGLGRWRTSANAGNDYQIDRDEQKNVSFTGIKGIFNQDHAVTESMGPTTDRTKEHLGSADLMIIRTRARMLAAARALAERDIAPPGVDEPEVFSVRSGSVFLPKNAHWLNDTEELRKAFVTHPEIAAQAEAGRF